MPGTPQNPVTPVTPDIMDTHDVRTIRAISDETRRAHRARRNLELQGWRGSDAARVLASGGADRIVPATLATSAAIGVASGAAGVFAVLAVIAAAGALRATHPVDAVYARAVAPRRHRPGLPRTRAARRFASAAAAAWLSVTALAAVSGHAGAATLLGCIFVVTSSVPALTGFCVPSWACTRLFGAGAAMGSSLIDVVRARPAPIRAGRVSMYRDQPSTAITRVLPR